MTSNRPRSPPLISSRRRFLKCDKRSPRRRPRSFPPRASSSRRRKALAVLWVRMASAKERICPREASPNMERTSASTIRVPQKLINWSSVDCASRIPPSAPRAMACRAASSSSTCSWRAILPRCSTISGVGIRRRSNRWQRLRMVGRTFSGSVVAKMNFTCGGGSSSVLSKALKAAVESM